MAPRKKQTLALPAHHQLHQNYTKYLLRSHFHSTASLWLASPQCCGQLGPAVTGQHRMALPIIHGAAEGGPLSSLIFALDGLALRLGRGFSPLPARGTPVLTLVTPPSPLIHGAQELRHYTRVPGGLQSSALPTPQAGTHLEVWAGDTLGQLPEQGLHDFHKLGRLDHVQDLFQFV